MTLCIRQAISEADKKRLFAFRYRVYVEELHLFHSVADHQKQVLTDDHDPQANLFFAEQNGNVCGTLRAHTGKAQVLHPEFEETYALSRFLKPAQNHSQNKGLDPEAILIVTRFMVKQNARGGLACWKLVKAIAEFARDREVEMAFIDCQPHLVSFYAKMGFRPYKRAYQDPQFGMMIPMVLLLSDIAYLQKIDSPLAASLAMRETRSPELIESMRCLISNQPPVQLWATMGFSADAWFNRWKATSVYVRHLCDLWNQQTKFGELLAQAVMLRCRQDDVLETRGKAGITLFWVIKGHLKTPATEHMKRVVIPGQVFACLHVAAGLFTAKHAVVASEHAEVLAINISAKQFKHLGSMKPMHRSLTA